MDWTGAIRETTACLSDPSVAHGGGLDPDLTRDVDAYVIDDGDASVLRRLGFYHQHLLGMGQPARPDQYPGLRRLYDALGDVPPEVVVRWSRVLDATLEGRMHALGVGGVTWPGALLAQIGLLYPVGDPPLGFFDLARVLAAGEVHSGQLVANAWRTPFTQPWWRARPELTLTRLRGYPAAVAQLHEWLAPRLVDGDVDARLHALAMLAPVDDDTLAAYADGVCEDAVSPSGQVSKQATPLVPRLGGAAGAPLRRLAVEAKPDQRRRALRLLWDTGDDEHRTFARETALVDRAASVRTVADAFTEQERDAVPVPEVADPAPVDWSVAWTDDVAAAVTGYAHEARWWGLADDSGQSGRLAYAVDEVVDLVRELLTSPDPVLTPVLHRRYDFRRSAALRQALERGALPSAAVVKLLVSGDLLADDYAGYQDLTWAAGLLHRHRGLTMLELASQLEGLPDHDAVAMLARAWFVDSPVALGRDWDPEAVWPFVARYLDGVLGYWHVRRAGHSYGFDSEALFPLIDTFPEPPGRLVELCYDLALGSAKSDQRAAQDYLTSHPDAVRRATAALESGNGTIRTEAAGWLGRIGDPDAVPALATAFGREKNETVQGALLDALVALGEPIEAHFDLASADAQAAKAMAKWPPAALTWLETDRLPDVRRAEGSSVVPRATMLWLVARATAAKSPVPSALLRACTAQLRTDDAEEFADMLLSLWVAADEASVGRTSWRHHRVGGGETGPSPGAAAKGLLALVAACGSASSVDVATRYVRTWHGQRAHQSKALVTMLAHHRHPAAAEALVAIAYRFKAPSIERTAREEVAALAERRGWSIDQLADRTVATAGFDEDGVLDLSYGDRTFTARLLPGCAVALLDPEGKVLKALPAPRQSDDALAARSAKKTLSAARKQLAETVKAQTVRLYDAMCAQRTWTGADWRQDLAGHPVLARLVATLVWVAETDDARVTFRLLDDGTLTDLADEPAEVAAGAVVRIAHDVTLTDEEVAAWQRHLGDYEIAPVFWQLGRGRAALTDEQAAQTVLDAGRASVPSGRLGRVTTSLGYRRGAVGDGAAFDWFEKEFASLGLCAKVSIEGHMIEDHTSDTTVEGLSVESTATGESVRLGELPPVLLVELRHDLAVLIAA